MRKSLAVAASAAALFLSLGAGCDDQGGNENGDRPGVENNQDDNQEGDQDEQDGDQDDGN